MKNFKAKIFVDPSVPPCFCKARSVPYAMKPLVEAELDKLVDQGIMTPVQHADWAAPIVRYGVIYDHLLGLLIYNPVNMVNMVNKGKQG